MSSLVWGLIQNLGLLALASVAFSNISRLYGGLAQRWQQLIGGGIFAGFSVAAMSGTALVWDEGVRLDLRLVPVVLAASFAGLPGALVTAGVAILYRAHMGGIGLLPGAVSILIACCFGIAASRYAPRSAGRIGLVVTGATLPVLSILLLPPVLSRFLMAEAALPLAVFNTIGCMILCTLVSREQWRVEVERELRLLAEADPLTGLANRRAFDRAAANLAAQPGARSLLLVDLDGLKLLNDRHGHDAGDRALKAVAEALRGVTAGRGTASRIGGDEFAVVLPDASAETARDVAERLRSQLTRITLGPGSGQTVSVSIGGVTCSGAALPEDLVSVADRALYRAKSGGRDRSEVEVLGTPGAA